VRKRPAGQYYFLGGVCTQGTDSTLYTNYAEYLRKKTYTIRLYSQNENITLHLNIYLS